MSESGEKTTTCLAITEKRPQTQRSGGCVGIFFQLFDWNRRFAKKKLFSKKLLPPARAKQAAKKFGGDEKMPKAKLHLIADENNGGFPHYKKIGIDSEQRHEMKSPSLVARLMGLDSMPAASREKPKKASVLESVDDGKKSFVGNQDVSGKEDFSLEKGSLKVESRPQKLQKTGPYERQAVTRFGAEAFQIKNVLSRSRKHHHHPNLASPVKSPRISSGRNGSRTRLIDVATRILEPGLHATNRAKCTLTYPSSMSYPPKDEIMTEVKGVASPEYFTESGYNNASPAKPLTGHSSCKNCGNFLDGVDFRSFEEEHCAFASSAPHVANVSRQGLEISQPRPPVALLDQEGDDILKNSRDQYVTPASQMKDNLQSRTETSRGGKLISKIGQEGWFSPTKPCKPYKDETSTVFKPRTLAQNQMSLGRDRVPSRAKLSNLQSRRVSAAANAVSGPKDYVALNRNLSGQTRPRVPGKVDDSGFDNQRKPCDKPDDSLSKIRSPVRKRRTLNVNGHVESTSFPRSKLGKERNPKCDALTGREIGVNSHSTHQSSSKGISSCRGESNRVNGNKDGDVISFSFNSPLRNKTGLVGTSEETSEKRRQQNDPISASRNAPRQRKLIVDGSDGKMPFQEPLPLCRDALSALLEQKLKELTSQEDDELATGTCLPKRSTAMILQELISALTAVQPISQNFDMSSKSTLFQPKSKKEGTVRFARDGDHLSPGSVLEASFSNDSCFSSSMDDSSGPRVPPDCMDFSYYQQQPSSDADLSDSATSLSRGKTCTEIVSNLINRISLVLQSMNLAGLSEIKITHAREVIITAELLFGNAARRNSDKMLNFLVGPFLLDEIERFVHSTRPHYIHSLSFEESKEEPLRGFLFDSMIECVDTKYSCYGSTGFKRWSRLPLHMNEGVLVQQIDKEVRKWTQMVGKTPDEIIEWEMSHSLGKWTDFDIEAFEIGEEIDRYILQKLVEEIVLDL